MKRIFVFLADGFEEIEALTPVDYLRRTELEVITVGISDKKITSSHGVTIICDKTITEVVDQIPDMVVFPGGLPNAKIASESQEAKAITLKVFKTGIVAGICAAPAMVFSKWGILKGRNFTCYPGMDSDLSEKADKSKRVVVDGNLITACGPGTAEEFAFALVEALAGKETLKKLQKETVSRVE